MKKFEKFKKESFAELIHSDELEIRFELIWYAEEIFYFYNKKLIIIYDKENKFFDLDKDIYNIIYKWEKDLYTIVEEVFKNDIVDIATIEQDKKIDVENYLY